MKPIIIAIVKLFTICMNLIVDTDFHIITSVTFNLTKVLLNKSESLNMY